MIKFYLRLLILSCSFSLFAQDYFPSNSGVKSDNNSNYTAFTNATIHVSPSEVIKNGTLLIKDGKVVNVGKSVKIPANTTKVDLSGKSIYPSFIDMYTTFGVKKPERGGNGPRYAASRSGFYWNDHIMPEQDVMASFKYDAKDASELHKLGFGAVTTHMPDGIVRGTGALIALNNDADNALRVVDGEVSQHLSFSKSVRSNQSYPSSIMGSMALLRQMYDDAKWYAAGNINTRDLSLEALNENRNLVQIFEAGSRANVLRADKVGDSHNIQYTIVGGGDEYERLDEIKATNATIILPIDFRMAYDVEDPFLASTLSLSDMRAWSQEPHNPRLLAENSVRFALTTHGLKSKKTFKANLMKAIESGLSKEKALEALTTVPAALLGKSNELGTLKIGAYANFLITSGDIFDKKTKLYENWVQGMQHVISNMNIKDIDGEYTFKLAGQDYDLTISGSTSKPKGKLESDNKSYDTKMNYADDWVNFTFKTADSTKTEYIRVAANVANGNTLSGTAIMPNGSEYSFFANKTSSDSDKKDNKSKEEETDDAFMSPITYPNLAYGFLEKPKSETLLFKNATVWTNEAEGILENTDVLIKNGKIAKIGKDLSDRSAKVIDATGKHITAGIIDEHSHIAAASINEGGHNSSAEVTIEDVIDDEDIDIYRNLAGGVTSIQILHGSANPIGGRSAIIKLKWGEAADDYIYDNSPKFIKFALGENVKQSRANRNERFPQSRMGVEQVFIDYFSRAKAYDEAKKSGKPYRKDTEMEVLVEILNGERFISCHSYVQSEINMLMKVAEQFNFRINTFTHILEGYKVANKMKEHGVGGSTFSDWWAYKYEVNDAIPYNAAIMHNAGVTVAINSDDAEMSRRLNQEAAKSVKYGGVSEEEALKFVTLNPAKLLHLDDRVGSLKVGKDADVVLWSDHPLSIYAKAEKTIIEGKTYFDLEKDKQMRAAIQKEKSDLINRMLKAKNKGLKTQPIKKKEKELLHCHSTQSGI
ncbi:imidazolonepropionase-like amidohydrolase [Winogradskyella wandonensis]|uniref:Imidazolonepropionase-like amidohydrolase n=1 Tax=Winogradskyella wandonensis TaxID=1442586 RepID=A0A4R1KVL5_9FLAO|nr:amidohydrolase family protein [Winogradskyella wandonensis]TCK68760.1 imidazolonepropionase-like amidohydrolase [Winogradskyella wandonensis]